MTPKIIIKIFAVGDVKLECYETRKNSAVLKDLRFYYTSLITLQLYIVAYICRIQVILILSLVYSKNG